MNQHDPQSQLRDNLTDALLRSAYQVDTQREQRSIENVLRRIETEGKSESDDVVQQETVQQDSFQDEALSPVHPNNPPRPRRWNRWASLAIAASLLLVIGIAIQFIGNSNHAMAAVERSIAAAQELIARHYRVTVTVKDSSTKSRVTQSDLYVQGVDQFALRHPALRPNADVWWGSDGTEAWFLPSIGPIRIGDQTGLGKWMKKREQLSTPILHVETILKRMKNEYRLKQNPNATLTFEDGTEVLCQHIVGTLNPQPDSTEPALNERTTTPETIELWSDIQTGLAIRLDAKFDHPSKGLTRALSVVFVDSPDLSDDWFAPRGHYRGFRRTLRFDSEE